MPRRGGARLIQSPGLSQTKKQILLKKAADLAGSREELAAQLKVPRHLIDAWIKGDATMPDGMLMQLAAALDRIAASKNFAR